MEQHKQKHDGSKPPYICEVCGAHYKHKRACDIHIALHQGRQAGPAVSHLQTYGVTDTTQYSYYSKILKYVTLMAHFRYK